MKSAPGADPRAPREASYLCPRAAWVRGPGTALVLALAAPAISDFYRREGRLTIFVGARGVAAYVA